MKVQSFIVCDDIRVEVGNKHTLVGVYDEQINFRVTPDKKDTWPKFLKLGFFAKIIIEDDNAKFFNFNFELGQEKKSFLQAAQFPKVNKVPDVMTIVYVVNSFELSKAGILRFSFDFLDEKKEIIQTISPDSNLIIKEVTVQT